MKRLSVDLTLAAAIAALPWLSMNSHTEPKRLGILASLYALTAILGHFRVIKGHAASIAVGLTMLGVGWLESFPAWNHSAEIGTYVLCGTAVIALASFRAARRSHLAEA